MKRLIVILGLLAGMSFFAVSSLQAGTIRVSPMRIHLDANRQTAALKIMNDGENKMVVQLSAITWHQDKEGNDKLGNEATDIIFFPKIFELEAGQQKLVRIGCQKIPADKEKTYRFFVRELPVSDPDQTALKFAVRLSLPVFVSPAKKNVTPVFGPIRISDGNAVITVINRGNVYFQPKKIVVTGLDASGAKVFSEETAGWYVLPGISRQFFVKLPEEVCRKVQQLRAKLTAGKIEMEKQVNVDQARCGR